MSARGERLDDAEYSPLGAGHQPAKDPLKALGGVMAGILTMESISLFLVLTVILRIADGTYWTTPRWGYVTIVAGAHFILAFFMGKRWAYVVLWVLQVLALAGSMVHISMGVVGLIFVIVWLYVFYLRNNLIERMKRGYLPSQHEE